MKNPTPCPCAMIICAFPLPTGTWRASASSCVPRVPLGIRHVTNVCVLSVRCEIMALFCCRSAGGAMVRVMSVVTISVLSAGVPRNRPLPVIGMSGFLGCFMVHDGTVYIPSESRCGARQRMMRRQGAARAILYRDHFREFSFGYSRSAIMKNLVRATPSFCASRSLCFLSWWRFDAFEFGDITPPRTQGVQLRLS